jgi:hypothetical protein
VAVVTELCVGKSECVVAATSAAFGPGDPCVNVLKTLSIRARGSTDCVPAPPPSDFVVNKSVMFDFGFNMAGFATMAFTAPAMPDGAVVEMRLKHTEITDQTGDAYNNCTVSCLFLERHARLC